MQNVGCVKTVWAGVVPKCNLNKTLKKNPLVVSPCGRARHVDRDAWGRKGPVSVPWARGTVQTTFLICPVAFLCRCWVVVVVVVVWCGVRVCVFAYTILIIIKPYVICSSRTVLYVCRILHWGWYVWCERSGRWWAHDTCTLLLLSVPNTWKVQKNAIH